LSALSESKPRGANRSTKVAGKLKVLPEQPDPLPNTQRLQIPGPPRDYEEGTGTTGDSEDGDDENEGGVDVEVCAGTYALWFTAVHFANTLLRFTINFR